MQNAVLIVRPYDLPQSGFTIDVKPYGGGMSKPQKAAFESADDLKKFLHGMDPSPELREQWGEAIDARKQFKIASTFGEWHRLTEWAKENF